MADLTLGGGRNAAGDDHGLLHPCERRECGASRYGARIGKRPHQGIFDARGPDDEGRGMRRQGEEAAAGHQLGRIVMDIEQRNAARWPIGTGENDGEAGLPRQVEAQIGLVHRRDRMA